MKAKKFLLDELQKIYAKTDDIKIRYEYDEETFMHVVEILPIDVYNSDEYMNLEIALSKQFDSLFPEEEVLFVSSDSLTGIKNPEYKIGYELEEMTLTVMETRNFSFDELTLVGMSYEFEYDDYALAA